MSGNDVTMFSINCIISPPRVLAQHPRKSNYNTQAFNVRFVMTTTRHRYFWNVVTFFAKFAYRLGSLVNKRVHCVALKWPTIHRGEMDLRLCSINFTEEMFLFCFFKFSMFSYELNFVVDPIAVPIE